jgi:tight adherence protein C
MKVALPDMLDLIVLSMDAGIGFDGALGRAVEKSRGPLSDEMRRVLNEISHGKTRAEAFSGLAARCRMEDLSLLLAAINQSEQLGTSIGTALRIQVHEIRRRRTQELREMAAKLPVKMLIPLVVCIFPTVLLIVLGPAAILLLKGGIFGQ